MTGTRCSACGGWSCERRRLHAAAERELRATRYLLQDRKLAGEVGRHESETLCAISRERSKLPKKEEQTCGHQPQDWTGKPLRFNLDFVGHVLEFSWSSCLHSFGGHGIVAPGPVLRSLSTPCYASFLRPCFFSSCSFSASLRLSFPSTLCHSLVLRCSKSTHKSRTSGFVVPREGTGYTSASTLVMTFLSVSDNRGLALLLTMWT